VLSPAPLLDCFSMNTESNLEYSYRLLLLGTFPKLESEFASGLKNTSGLERTASHL